LSRERKKLWWGKLHQGRIIRKERTVMKHLTITNPRTNRKNRVVAWDIQPREVLGMVQSGQIGSAQDLSWMLLSDDESIEKMQEEEYGDSAENNFPLRVFETALDWGLGLTVLNFIYGAVADGKMPRPFQVAANRQGDVFIITASGKVF
jgi:hypothetical protein